MKKIVEIVYGLILLFSLNIIYASTKTYERNENNNYGVNKKIDISDKMSYIMNAKMVDASEKIYDFSDILTDEEEATLYNKVIEFINRTDMDFVVLTDNVPYTNDEENDNYVYDFYDYNDFGIKYEKYDGVIFFRNTYEEDPYYGLYMTGKAQLYIDESRFNNILDNITYDIRNKNYLNSISIIIDNFISYYDEGIPEDYKNAYIDENGFLIIPEKYNPPFVLAGIIAAIVTGITMGILISKNKMVYKAKEANEYLDKDSIKYNRKESHLVSSNTTRHYNPPSSSSGGSSGFHSSGGSSGIGHSGGGRHG